MEPLNAVKEAIAIINLAMDDNIDELYDLLSRLTDDEKRVTMGALAAFAVRLLDERDDGAQLLQSWGIAAAVLEG